MFSSNNYTRFPPVPPSHSGEGRNLRRREAAGNFAPTARRFRLSPEWRHF
ncbi:MAG: hypothetical protein ACR2QC_05250 [Gammaproteobacteria bacterium]